MQLPFFSKNKEQDFYFGLFLKEGEGIGFIFKKSNNGLKILTKEKFTYSNDWDNLTEDIDEVLVRLEDETRIRVKETIFFVYSHLVDEKSRTIKRPYLPKIRELSKNLELRPLGYIECQEAVVGHLENKEQTPLTSVLIELDTTNLDILIYKGGHEAFRKVILRSENLIDDLLSVLHEVKGMILLPSRMILYNSSNLSHLATQIVSHRWETDLFIQTPRVEIFKEEDIFQALMDFFGKQIDEKPVKEEVETKKPEKIMGFVVGGDIKEEVANENINNFQLLTVLKNKFICPN